MKGMALQVRGKKYVCFKALLPTLPGYRMMVGAHNTVGCQMYMGGPSSCLGMADVGTCIYC